VDHNLVRSWLGLPPGPWPPDHYTILGLPTGQADPAAVEPVVLDRMDRLRRHQLLHPELVTEGMNRLAQALITLTDAAEKAAYDAELGLPTLSAPPPPPARPPARPKSAAPARGEPLVIASPVFEDAFADEAPVGIRVDPDDTQEIEIPSFEVIDAEPPSGNLVVSTAELMDFPEAPPASGGGPVGVVEAVALAPGRRRATDPATRRWVYTRLALVRRAVRTWERFRPLFVDPEDPVARPGRVLLLLEATVATRDILPHLRGVIGEFGQPGGLVAALVNRPLVLDTFRRLLPDQRLVVGADWKAGLAELHGEYARLRQISRQGRSALAGPAGSLLLWRWLRDNPEWALLLLAGLCVFVAMVRGSTGP
jgi:hypothetical protein